MRAARTTTGVPIRGGVAIAKGSDCTGIGEISAGADNLGGENRDGFGCPHAQRGSGDWANASPPESKQKLKTRNEDSRMKGSPNLDNSRSILTSDSADGYRVPRKVAGILVFTERKFGRFLRIEKSNHRRTGFACFQFTTTRPNRRDPHAASFS